MLATAFDPLAAARDLKAAGFESEQAEALAAQLRFAAGADHADLATKADIAALKADIDALRADTKADLAELRADTKADLAGLRADTKTDLDALRKETKADLHREIGTLRSELRWILGFLAALILAMAAKLFGIV